MKKADRSKLSSQVPKDYGDCGAGKASPRGFQVQEVWGDDRLLSELLKRISGGQFISGVTVHDMALESGRTLQSVSAQLVVARARLQDRMSADERRHILTACLEHASSRALAGGDYGSAIRGFAEIGKIHGLVEKKLVLSGSLHALSPAEELEQIRKLKADIELLEQRVIEERRDASLALSAAPIHTQSTAYSHVVDGEFESESCPPVPPSHPVGFADLAEDVVGPGHQPISENMEKKV
jgi:hypothetical protein